MFVHHKLGTDQMMSLEKIDSCDRSQLFIGNMEWTAMLFLNDDDDFEGGNVYFQDEKIEPEAGKLVCWPNKTSTIYNDISVLSGTKLIALKGYNKL
jgi:hypothetical protein